MSTYSVSLDAQRRLTLPVGLVTEAGLDDAEDLVAYSEQGCIVISTRARLLSGVQEMFRDARGQDEVDPVEVLVAERARDAAVEADRRR